MIKKCTEGVVEQFFNHYGELISQRFVAGDMVEFYTQNDDKICDLGQENFLYSLYSPFDMVQPKY